MQEMRQNEIILMGELLNTRQYPLWKESLEANRVLVASPHRSRVYYKNGSQQEQGPANKTYEFGSCS